MRSSSPTESPAFPPLRRLALTLLAAAASAAVRADTAPPAVAAGDAKSGIPRVTRIDLDVRLDPTIRLMTQEATITVEGRGPDILRFALAEALAVEKCSADRGIADYRKAGSSVEVTIDPPLDGRRTLRFLVTGTPERESMPLLRSEWIAFGDEDAWYPKFPRIAAETRVVIRPPRGWVAVAPGVRSTGGAAGTWEWRSKGPVRHLAIAAAPELRVTEGQLVKTPLTVAAPAGAPDAKVVTERGRDALAWFAASFGPYPSESFNIVLLPRFPVSLRATGMLVASASVPLGTASDGADLLASQWFGEQVAGEGRFMEAFAAWAATVFAKDRGLPPPAEIERLRRGYFTLLSGDVALARADASTPEEVLRGKGSAAPEMVRLLVGDRPFMAGIRALFSVPRPEPLSLAEVRAVFEAEARRSLSAPFQEWFERAGAPQLDASLRVMPAAEGGFRADITIVQKRGSYTLPVEVLFRGPGEEHTETVEIEETTTSPFYILPFEPVRIELDPSRKIFRWP